MKSIFAPSLFCCVLAHTALAQEAVRPVEGLHENDPGLHALVGGTVVTPEGERAATVVVRSGKFAAIGEGVAVPEGARVWDVKGKRLYAGLVEPWWEVDPGGEKEGPHWNPAVRPERRVADGYSLGGDDLEARRKLGFTVANLLPKDGIFRGQASIVLLRDGGRGEQVIVPSSGQVVDLARRTGGYPRSLMGSVALVRQTFSDAAWYRSAAAAHAANPAEIKRPATDASLAAIDLQAPVLWRARDESSFARIARLAGEFELKPALLGNGYEYRQAQAVASFGDRLFVPLNFPKRPSIEDAVAALDYALADLEHWEFAPSNPAFLAKQKVEFGFTAHGLEDKGAKFWENVRLAVERGLPAGQALASLTSRPAKVLGIGDRCGAVAPGLFANLIIADGDLFTDKDAKIEATWVDGLPYEFPKVHDPDASGVWEVKGFGDAVQRWEIAKGKNPKVSNGETKFKGQWKNGDLLFFPPAEMLGTGSGTARLSAGHDAEAGALSGIAVTPGGQPIWWSAKRVGDLEKKGEENEEADEDEEDRETVPELVFDRYPAGAFGFAGAPEQPAAVLLKGATVWTCGEAGVIEEGDVLIQDGKVSEVGKGLAAPDGATVIDAKGKHVTPGLVDCHSHTAISRGVNEGSHAVTVEVGIADSVNPADINLYRQLGGGLTTANLLHGSANPMGGQNQVIKLRWGSDADGLRFQGAMPGVKFALGENVKQSNWGPDNNTRYPQTRMGVEQIMKDSFVAALDYRAARNRAVQSGAPHRRNLRMDALLEILDGRRIVHIHSYRQDEILMFVRLAQEFGFTVGTFQHVLEGYKVADEIASIGAGGSSFSDWWAYKFEVEDAIPFNGALLHEAGVVTSFNSDDSELACRMNGEAAKAVKYGGVSPEEALKFVTINPAKQLRIDARVGSLEPGKDADFVIWSAPPLSTYARTEQTWIDGRCYFDLKVDAELRAEASEKRERLVAKILAESVGDEEGGDDDEDGEGEAGGSGERKKEPERRFRWLPAWVGNVACTSADRGLYHSGNNEHTCSGASCCGVR